MISHSFIRSKHLCVNENRSMTIFLPNDNLCVFESNAVALHDVHKYEKPAIISRKLSRIMEDMNKISEDDASEAMKKETRMSFGSYKRNSYKNVLAKNIFTKWGDPPFLFSIGEKERFHKSEMFLSTKEIVPSH